MTPIALHSTSNGFAIAILHNKRSGQYAVARVNPEDQYIVIDCRKTESEARRLANHHWSLDR